MECRPVCSYWWRRRTSSWDFRHPWWRRSGRAPAQSWVAKRWAKWRQTRRPADSTRPAGEAGASAGTGPRRTWPPVAPPARYQWTSSPNVHTERAQHTTQILAQTLNTTERWNFCSFIWTCNENLSATRLISAKFTFSVSNLIRFRKDEGIRQAFWRLTGAWTLGQHHYTVLEANVTQNSIRQYRKSRGAGRSTGNVMKCPSHTALPLPTKQLKDKRERTCFLFSPPPGGRKSWWPSIFSRISLPGLPWYDPKCWNQYSIINPFSWSAWNFNRHHAWYQEYIIQLLDHTESRIVMMNPMI